MIPKIIHYVWVGGPLPDHHKAYMASWQETNPEFQIICWNEDNIDFGLPAVERAYRDKQYNKVSDLVRHVVVMQMGGIYLDTDFQLFKPLDILLSHKCFYGFQHETDHPDWIAPGAFGAEPGHWFLAKVLDRMSEIEGTIMGRTRVTTLGPQLVTSMLRNEGLSAYSPSGVYVKDIFCTPKHWFYPFDLGETFTPECVRDDTLAAHFWEGSWIKKTSVARKVVRSVMNVARR
jgi:mannosyltransferase OCH1-like enzyme